MCHVYLYICKYIVQYANFTFYFCFYHATDLSRWFFFIQFSETFAYSMFYYNNVLIKFIKLINIVCSRFYVLEKFMMHSASYITRLCRLIRSPWRWVNLSSREINTLSKYSSLRKLRCYSEIKIARCSEALRDANITFYMI